eukprot:GHVR01061290.1.p1 GENE.GHVR01061290.1~~GHVR01061290.1.p1  ORF type:complete len:119 (-),score=1.83 GHVR01061290.1:665-1021(-)
MSTTSWYMLRIFTYKTYKNSFWMTQRLSYTHTYLGMQLTKINDHSMKLDMRTYLQSIDIETDPPCKTKIADKHIRHKFHTPINPTNESSKCFQKLLGQIMWAGRVLPDILYWRNISKF